MGKSRGRREIDRRPLRAMLLDSIPEDRIKWGRQILMQLYNLAVCTFCEAHPSYASLLRSPNLDILFTLLGGSLTAFGK